MSSLMTRRCYTALILACFLSLVCSSMALAGTESTTDTWLVFHLATDSASYRNCDYSGDTLLEIPFNIMKADGDGSDTIVAVETRIIYDPTIMTLVSVDANTNHWPYNFTYTDTVENDTCYIFMLFEDTTGVGVMTTAQYERYATLTFKFNCNSYMSDYDFAYKQGTNLNWVDYKLGGIFDPGILFAGDAILKDLWSDLRLPDTTVYDAIGDTIDIPIYLHNNNKTYYIATEVTFDTTLLEYVGTYRPGGADYGLSANQNGASIHAFNWKFSGFGGFESEAPLIFHRFIANAGAWSETIDMTFGDSCFVYAPCVYYPVALSTTDGSLTFSDTAHYAASVVETDPRHYGDTITYDISLTNTFTVGDKTSSPDDTAGVVVNVNLGTFMEYVDVASLDDEMYFEGTERDDWKVSLFQVIDAVKGDTMAPGTDQDMVRMKTVMTSPPTTLPTWNNPYIYGPSFVEMNAAAYDTSRATAANYDGAATYANSQLSWDDFPGAPAAVCLFYNYADSYYKAGCEEVDVWVKANSETDSIHVTVSVSATYDIDDAWLLTGITVTQTQDNVLTLESDGSFAGISANDSVKIAEVAITCNYMSNGYANLAYSNLWAENSGDRLFTDASAGSIYVRCDAACPDPVFNKPSDGLPTTFALHQNYPNPFNPTTQILLDLPEPAAWRIEIYNMLGQLVDDFEGHAGPGTVSVEWNAGSHATGVYLYRAMAGDCVETKKMLFLK